MCVWFCDLHLVLFMVPLKFSYRGRGACCAAYSHPLRCPLCCSHIIVIGESAALPAAAAFASDKDVSSLSPRPTGIDRRPAATSTPR